MTSDEIKSYVGKELQIRGVKHLCIAASKDALLFLQFDSSNQPIQYIVAHHPDIYEGQMVWAQGGYHPFYQSWHEGDTMTDALRDAAMELNDTTLYVAIADDDSGTRCIGTFTHQDIAKRALEKVLNRSDYVEGLRYAKRMEPISLETYMVLKDKYLLNDAYWIEEHEPNQATK